MVIMKVRPAREINGAVLNERLKHMGLPMLCTLEPTRWDPDERMIAASCRSLDSDTMSCIGDICIAVNRPD